MLVAVLSTMITVFLWALWFACWIRSSSASSIVPKSIIHILTLWLLIHTMIDMGLLIGICLLIGRGLLIDSRLFTQLLSCYMLLSLASSEIMTPWLWVCRAMIFAHLLTRLLLVEKRVPHVGVRISLLLVLILLMVLLLSPILFTGSIFLGRVLMHSLLLL